MPERSGPMTCPVDGTTLVMSERQNIEIDYCPTCRGVWLDRGELDKIIERSSADAAAPQQPQAPPQASMPPMPPQAPQQQHYGDPYSDRGRDYGHHRPHKRRKSFLEELFD
ncbi:MAG TPA: zf-TFIIB domain-containing protein [Allosphingosinicella sp.]|nr:zf-TFIIB domain-containing protein [Allosphingosinicella sp.]